MWKNWLFSQLMLVNINLTANVGELLVVCSQQANSCCLFMLLLTKCWSVFCAFSVL